LQQVAKIEFDWNQSRLLSRFTNREFVPQGIFSESCLFKFPRGNMRGRRKNTSRAVSSRTTMSSSDALAQASRHLLAGATETKRFEWIVVCGGFLAFFAAFGIGTHTMRALFTFRVHRL
jgi:sodium-dependent phosphate transporter